MVGKKPKMYLLVHFKKMLFLHLVTLRFRIDLGQIPDLLCNHICKDKMAQTYETNVSTNMLKMVKHFHRKCLLFSHLDNYSSLPIQRG